MNMPWKKPEPHMPLAGPLAPSYTIPAAGPPVDPIKAAIDELAKVRKDKKAAEKREEQLKEILDALGASEELYSGNTVALQITESYPERFDGKAFEADYPEIYAEYKRKAEKPTRTLTIKPLI